MPLPGVFKFSNASPEPCLQASTHLTFDPFFSELIARPSASKEKMLRCIKKTIEAQDTYKQLARDCKLLSNIWFLLSQAYEQSLVDVTAAYWPLKDVEGQQGP